MIMARVRAGRQEIPKSVQEILSEVIRRPHARGRDRCRLARQRACVQEPVAVRVGEPVESDVPPEEGDRRHERRRSAG
jgi:hypothetical protein